MLNRQRVSANGFLSPYAMDAPALGMDGPYYTEATVGLFAGLDLDSWGVHRSAVAAAIGAHNAALAETAAVELSLTTGVASFITVCRPAIRCSIVRQTREVIDYAGEKRTSKRRTVSSNMRAFPRRAGTDSGRSINKLLPSKGKSPKRENL